MSSAHSEEVSSFNEAVKRAKEIALKVSKNEETDQNIKADSTDSQSLEPVQKKSSLTVSTVPSAASLALASDAIRNARNMLLKICEEKKIPASFSDTPSLGVGSNEHSDQLMVPAGLVGLIIGKGGETIKNLAERAGCRMVMLQDGIYANASEKPLLITGDPLRVKEGKELARQFLADKDKRFGAAMENDEIVEDEMKVPREAVGLVIGKGGETIRKINVDSNCRVHFRFPADIGDQPEKVCTFIGGPKEVAKAKIMVQEIIDMVVQKKNGIVAPRGPMMMGPDCETEEVPVCSLKAGLIIGRGGEFIKQINTTSGAFVEINKNNPEDSSYRTFFITGLRHQIEHAKQMMKMKVGEENVLPPIVPGTGPTHWNSPYSNPLVALAAQLSNPVTAAAYFASQQTQEQNNSNPSLTDFQQWYSQLSQMPPGMYPPTIPGQVPMFMPPAPLPPCQIDPNDPSSWMPYYQSFQPYEGVQSNNMDPNLSNNNSVNTPNNQESNDNSLSSQYNDWTSYYQQYYSANTGMSSETKQIESNKQK